MPFCPACEIEYRGGFTVCADCGASLVNELPKTGPVESAAPEDTPGFSRESPALLCSLPDGPDTDMVISLLTENGIPALGMQQGSGQFLRIYMGMSFQSVDIYVPDKALPRAIDLVYPLLAEKEELSAEQEEASHDTGDDDSFGNEVRQEGRRRYVKVWLIILLFTPGLLWVLIIFLTRLLGT